MTVTLFDLTGEAMRLHDRINSVAELLFSDDLQEVADATAALEALITDETNNRRAIEAKADAWCWVIDCVRARAVAQRDHARRLAELADEAELRAQALQDQLVAALNRIDPDATSWALPEHKLTSRRSTAVELDPDVMPQDLPEQYQRSKTVVSADKTALKAALQAGTAVSGAQLVERRSWSIK